MRNKQKLKPVGRNLAVLLARAGSEVKPGTANLATVLHDDWCRSLMTYNRMDCHGTPEITIQPVNIPDDNIMGDR